MTVVADESVDQPVVERLRSDGVPVVAIAEVSPGIDDETVLSRAEASDAVLLTGDEDFGELVYRLGRAHAGIVLIRLDGLSNQEKADVVSDAFRDHGNEFHGAFSVLSATSLRIRRRS